MAKVYVVSSKSQSKFSAYKGKEYIGVIDSVTSRIDAQTRSILVRAKIKNNNLEILPGSLLEVTVNYNQGNSLGIPDTSVFFYKYFGSFPFFHLILHPRLGIWFSSGGLSLSKFSSAFLNSLPVIGFSFPGLASSKRPR